MDILLATGNKNKVCELQEMLDENKWQVKSLRDFPEVVIPPEDAPDFLGNAFIKARAAAKQTGLLTLADDSGLVVDALDGAPGVYSARYAGEGHDDDANNRKLLRELAEVPAGERTARFMSCIALVTPEGREEYAIGACEGRIGFKEAGTEGFGYDPLFIVEGIDKTMSELTLQEKNDVSHRGKALKEILVKLAEIY
ncbi:MAG: XTP/dITP diphosphatase [Bacillota bacterium]|jgi:XTP/dITP diphosphohydrolase